MESYNKPILIIGHNAVIKVLLGYFANIPLKEIPHLNVDLGKVIKLTPTSKEYFLENIVI